MNYIISRPVKTDDGAFIRIDEVRVAEEEIMDVLSLLMLEPWTLKLVIRKENV